MKSWPFTTIPAGPEAVRITAAAAFQAEAQAMSSDALHKTSFLWLSGTVLFVAAGFHALAFKDRSEWTFPMVQPRLHLLLHLAAGAF